MIAIHGMNINTRQRTVLKSDVIVCVCVCVCVFVCVCVRERERESERAREREREREREEGGRESRGCATCVFVS